MFLRKFTIRIKDIEERYANGEKFFVYTVWIRRNDGLQWMIQRRYSQIYEFRNYLMQYSDIDVGFPLKFWFLFLAKKGFFSKEEFVEILE